MTPLSFFELPVSSRMSVWWSFLWRGLVISFASGLSGGILGFVAGIILGLARLRNVAPLVGGFLGLGAGIAFSYLFLRWLLSSRLGRFRLLLVRVEDEV